MEMTLCCSIHLIFLSVVVVSLFVEFLENQELQQQQYYQQHNSVADITDSSVILPNNGQPPPLLQNSSTITIEHASLPNYESSSYLNDGVPSSGIQGFIERPSVGNSEEEYLSAKRMKLSVQLDRQFDF